MIEKLFFKGKDGWRVKVYVKTNSPKEKIEINEDGIVFYTQEPPLQGRANAALIKTFSKIFDVSTSKVEIVYGIRDRSKVVEIKIKELEKLLERLKHYLSLQEQ